MENLEGIRARLPESARDIKLNLQAVFQKGALTPEQLWGVAIACAATTRHRPLLDATLLDARNVVSGNVVEDAMAAAALMAMNNVYYRFRHLVGKESYSKKPARLRMNRLAKVLGHRVDFELFCLAVSSINGCEVCVQSHERVVTEAGVSEDAVHDAVRIAATFQAAAVALELAELPLRREEAVA